MFYFYVGLFLITSNTLMLQLIQTRILSVVSWYHLAFFAISMAMFGLTVGSIWIYLRREGFTKKTLSKDLCYFTMAFAWTTVLSMMVQMTLLPVSSLHLFSFSALFSWVEIGLCLALPFFFSGVVVSLALTRSPFPIGRVYAVDMIGASLGCLGVLVILHYTDGPSGILWVAACSALAAWFFSKSQLDSSPSPSPRRFAQGLFNFPLLTALFFSLLATLNGLTDYGLQPLVVKEEFEGGSSFHLRRWNSFSRVVLFKEDGERSPVLWASSSTFKPEQWKTQHAFMYIDGDASTPAYRFDGDFRKVDFLKYDITTLAYNLKGRTKAGVIGVGGGRDVLSAALFGYKEVVGVEINPIFIELLKDPQWLGSFNEIHRLEGVRLVVDEGRSWFARTSEKFDLIQMSLIDTWASTGSGAFTLSENGLYTTEAWKLFLNRLAPQGVFTVTRWYQPQNLTETGRMMSLATAALLEMGVTNPRDHLFLAAEEKKGVATLVLSREPFRAEDLKVLHETVQQYRYKILLAPQTPSPSDILKSIVSCKDLESLYDYTSDYHFDLTPAVDDRPFFFNQLPLHKIFQAVQLIQFGQGPSVRNGNLMATLTLFILFLIALLFVLLSIILPLRSAMRDVGKGFALGGTFYFLLIGFGYMLVEIALLQRLSVFLGHPSYSLSVLLFSLILSTGLGSLFSDRFPLRRTFIFALWAGITSAYAFSLPLWLPQIFHQYEAATLLTRALLCVAVVLPAGFLMGYGFPTGMRMVSQVDPKPTPWFWGINGAAGVLAAVLAVACSLTWGIHQTMQAGALCYALLIPVTLLFMKAGFAPSSSSS
jgi:spermidine synthase